MSSRTVRLASLLLVAAARQCDALAVGTTPGAVVRDRPHRAVAVLALSASEQYAQQQAELRERRQARLEAEAEAASGEDDPAEMARRAAEQAEREAFEQRFGEQLGVFNRALFPPDQYTARNSESRKDGYWPFTAKGEEPPLDFTYGEFPLPLFAKLVDRACELRGIGDRTSTVLADLGSGAGRLALWAAATSSWKRVVGVEYLPTLAATATAKLDEARTAFPALLRTSDVQLVEGSWDDPLELFADIDVSTPASNPPPLTILPSLAHPLSRLLLSRLLCVCLQVAFAYTTAITASDDGVLVALSAALAQRLKFGCIVVTTDYTLDPSAFELLEAIEGENTGVGGRSTGFIHRKICAGERDDEDAAAAYVPPPPTSDELSAAADFHAMELLLLHNLEADSRNRSGPP